MLRLHDTATRSPAPLPGFERGEVGMYVCGPTVYAPPHIGHGRLVLVYDVLRRYLESRGVSVLHVCNVTDIDDKIIDVANRDGRSAQSVAEEYEESWWSAMGRLGALRPSVVPHATEYVDDMVSLISDLVSRGVAYETGDGVYLEVARVGGYGLLAQQSLESLRAGARVEVNASKRAPFDFALWKKAKPGEPSWDAPFGAGRPGWHTECVAMAFDVLGEGFSLHGAGEDLKFPHNENERAQSVALDRPYARLWMHNGMLLFDGEKMSKSLGNTLDLSALLSESDPRAYRLAILQAHYRVQMELNPEALDGTGRAVRGLDALSRRVEEAAAAGSGAEAAEAPQANAAELVARFRQHMDDDLDTPKALAVAFEGMTSANVAFDSSEAGAGLALGRAAIDCFSSVGLTPAHGEVSAEALELASKRDSARAERDWAAADRLRDEIVALGYRVEDTPSGTRVLR